MGKVKLGGVKYRKLNPEESKDYRLLRLESLQKYPNSFGSNYEDQKQREKLAFENFIENADPESFIFGAFEEGNIIGICGFYRNKDENCRHRGEIIQMYVQTQCQGNQVGFNLLSETVLEAFKLKGLEQIELEVMTTVKAANKIYEKLGFQEFGVQKNLYKKEGVYFDQRFMILFKDQAQ